MRLAPVPVFFRRDPVMAAKISAASSAATHPGLIAAAACAFFGFAIAKAITRETDHMTAAEFLNATVKEFVSLGMPGAKGCTEIERLLRCAEPVGKEECWNWNQPHLQLNRTLRARGDTYNGYPCSAGYFGSYSVDGLAVALWSFYHTNSYMEAIVRCANFLGDAETTAAICGQLAGAFYGYGAIDPRLIEKIEQYDDKDIACR